MNVFLFSTFNQMYHNSSWLILERSKTLHTTWITFRMSMNKQMEPYMQFARLEPLRGTIIIIFINMNIIFILMNIITINIVLIFQRFSAFVDSSPRKVKSVSPASAGGVQTARPDICTDSCRHEARQWVTLRKGNGIWISTETWRSVCFTRW